jgi:hypothetical protein
VEPAAGRDPRRVGRFTGEHYRLRAPAGGPGAANWTAVDSPAVAPARSDARLLGCDVIGDRLLLTLRRDGEPLLAITDLDGGHVIEVRPSLAAGTIRVEHAEDYDARSSSGRSR